MSFGQNDTDPTALFLLMERVAPPAPSRLRLRRAEAANNQLFFNYNADPLL